MTENLVSWSIGSLSRLNKKQKQKFPTKTANKKIYQKEHILELLAKPKLQRTKIDIRNISEYLANKYDFFIKLKETSDVLKLEKICSVLNLERFAPGEEIINYGEEGDKFYIVLEGLVGVYVPIYPQKRMMINDYVDYMKQIIQREQNELKYQRINEKNAECKIDIQLLISISSTSTLAAGKREMNFFIEEYDKLGEFGDGFKFGEIALIKKTARNATITAISSTQLLTIEKSDYNKSIRELEEKRLEKQLNDFKCNYPLFQYWTLNHLIKLFNCFSKIVLTKGDYLYKQNEEADSVYIITNGVFEVYSMVSFGWVDAFFTYIKEAKCNLLHFLNDEKPYKEKALRDIFNATMKQVHESPCQYDPLKIAKITSSNSKNDIDIMEITQEEEGLLDPYNLFKVHIKTINYKDVIGIEDAIEIKKRFSFVRCVSPFGEVQKVKLYDFFRLVNQSTESNNKEMIKSIIAEKKCILHNQIKKAIVNLSLKNKVKFETKIASFLQRNNNNNSIINSTNAEQISKKVMKINKYFHKNLSLLLNHHKNGSKNKYITKVNSNLYSNQHCDVTGDHQVPKNVKAIINETPIKKSALANYTLFSNKDQKNESKEFKEELCSMNSCVNHTHTHTQLQTQANTSLNRFKGKHFKSRSSNNRIISPLSTKSISSFIRYSMNKSKLHKPHKLFLKSEQRNATANSNMLHTSRSNFKYNTENRNTINTKHYLRSLESNYDIFQSEIFKMAGVKRKVPLKEIFGTIYDETDVNVLQIESSGNTKAKVNSNSNTSTNIKAKEKEKSTSQSLTSCYNKLKSINGYSMELKMKNFKSLHKSKCALNSNV